MGRLYNVQALRGFAALIVVLAHLTIPIPFFSAAGAETLSQGRAGVDIFFVISGFIMAYGARHRSDTPAGFLRRRIVRITPLYWAVTLFLFALAVAFPRLLPAGVANGLHLLKSLFFIPERTGSIIFQAWTLDYEMLFYGLFAMGLVFTGYRRFLVPTAIIVALVVLGRLTSHAFYPWAFFTNPIMLEFCGGMVVALVHERIAAPRAVLICGALLSLIALAFGAQNPTGPLLRVITSGAPAMVLVFCAVSLELKGLQARWFPIQLLGDASYAMYLTHPFVTRLYERLPIGIDLRAHPVVAIAALILVLSLVSLVAVAAHKLVEKPLTNLAGRLWPGAAAPSLAPAT